MLSGAQIKYLLVIYNDCKGTAGISEIASNLGVSKASVHKMVSNLSQLGLVHKELYGEVGLTEQGKAAGKNYRDKYLKLLWYFTEQMDYDVDVAKYDAVNFISYISEELVDKFICKIEGENNVHRYEVKYLHDDINLIPENGRYEIPFKLLKVCENNVSMGNKALVHPCSLTVNNRNMVLVLKAKKIIHNSITGKKLTGTLNTLLYWNGEQYIIAEKEDNIFYIPIYDTSKLKGKCGKIRNGTIMVKVQASVGNYNMPESEAKLRLNLASRRKYS